MSSMRETLTDILSKIQKELEHHRNSGRPESDSNYQRALINAALFYAAMTSVNEKRNRTRPDDYEQRPGFEKYKNTVSGPCHKILLILTETESNNIQEDKVTSKELQKLAKDACSVYLDGKLAKGGLENYKDYNGTPNYSDLYRDIQKLKQNKYLLNRFTYKLVSDCCLDLQCRTKRNIEIEKTAAHRKFIGKIKDTDKQQRTYVSFAIATSTCRATISELNKAYENADNKGLRERMEQIFIPVFSNSPYFFLCISHKKNLPKEILDKCDKNHYFVFVITTAEYIHKKSDRPTSEYSVKYNVVSHDYVKSIQDLPLDIVADLNEREVTEDKKINRIFYTNKKNPDCCAMSYDDMIAKYNYCCNYYFKGSPLMDNNEDHWLPLDLPKEITDMLSPLYITGSGYNLSEIFSKGQDISESSPLLSAYDKSFEGIPHRPIIGGNH
ncbi:MAG: hypothetical protein E7383_00450 [Ruminococcaceae bacterium]|nr:hypothetical protein [Oscillospiraceae bacterium]